VQIGDLVAVTPDGGHHGTWLGIVISKRERHLDVLQRELWWNVLRPSAHRVESAHEKWMEVLSENR